MFNLFGKKKKVEEENPDQDLQIKIAEGLRKAEQDKRTASNEINKLYGFAAEAIIDTFAEYFPNANYSFYRDKYKTEALAKYAEYKTQHASKLSPEVLDRCEKIVNGYLNHASLLESKIKFYDKLVTDYTQAKEKIKIAISQNTKTDKLKKHAERLDELDGSSNVLASTYTDSYKLEDITKELEIREEYANQIEKLTIEYGNDTEYNNSLAMKDEVDKMIGEMK